MKADIYQIKEKVLPILIEEGVTKSSLFGSCVRDDFNESSDIDMLVEYPRGKSLFDFIGLQNKLEDVLHKKVDLVTYKGLKPRIRDRILNEQVQIL